MTPNWTKLDHDRLASAQAAYDARVVYPEERNKQMSDHAYEQLQSENAYLWQRLAAVESEACDMEEKSCRILADKLAAAEEECMKKTVQLAGVSVAAMGGTSEAFLAKKGDYGWSLPYEDVLKLRRKYDASEKRCERLLDLYRRERDNLWDTLSPAGDREMFDRATEAAIKAARGEGK